MFTVDGIRWDIPCKVERMAEITPSNISGMLLNKQYFNDVIGTFMRYSISLALPFGREDLYTTIYEKLTEPVDGHVFNVPYDQGFIDITGRVENVKDTYLRRKSRGVNYWMEISFEVISNAPTKTMELGEVIMRGLAPLPDESDVSVGETYIYTSNGWEEMTDADDNYY